MTCWLANYLLQTISRDLANLHSFLPFLFWSLRIVLSSASLGRLGVFHFSELGKNSTNLNHHFSSIFKGTMAWISINTKLFQTQIWLEKWYENGEILHFVSSFENGLRARSCEWPGRSILNILKSINKKIVWWMNRAEG